MWWHKGLWMGLLGLSVCGMVLPQQTRRIGAVVPSVQSSQNKSSVSLSRFKYIDLDGGVLHLDFDLIGSEEPLLGYRLRHCNADWTPSSLSPIEFVSGFDSYELPSPAPSRNTLEYYAHYKLSIPNEQTQIKHSGNYLLEVFDLDDPEVVLLSFHFAVTERLATISAEQTSRTWQESDGRYQQVNLSVDTSPLQLASPTRDLKPVVLQNGRWDNAQRLLTPSAREGHKLHYAMNRGAIFEAGNEYHKLEHLLGRGGGIGIDKVDVEDALYSLHLYPQRERANDAYVYDEDQNGIQVIRTMEGLLPETEADYHLVHFTYYAPLLTDGKVVLEGDCVQYMPLEERTLHYNPSKQRYELTLPLKMGYQEYQYLYLPDGTTTMSASKTEGNHYQTSNSYTALLYQRAPSDRADRLIGVTEIK